MFGKIFLAVLPAVSVATFAWGTCPAVSLQKDFRISKYTGVWYELVRNKDVPFEKGDCVQANYTLNSDGTLNVVNSEIVDGVLRSVIGTAHCEAQNPASCYVKFSEYGPEGDYKIVTTDYNNFSVVYSCTSWGISCIKWAWILARNKKFDFTTMIEEIQKLGIGIEDLHFTKQENC